MSFLRRPVKAFGSFSGFRSAFPAPFLFAHENVLYYDYAKQCPMWYNSHMGKKQDTDMQNA